MHVIPVDEVFHDSFALSRILACQRATAKEESLPVVLHVGGQATPEQKQNLPVSMVPGYAGPTDLQTTTNLAASSMATEAPLPGGRESSANSSAE